MAIVEENIIWSLLRYITTSNMQYRNYTTNAFYNGGAMTMILPNGSLFSGIPTNEQLEAWV